MAAPYPALAKAIYDYTAGNPDELTIKEGDILTIESQDENGWCKGRALDGKEGLFPFSYVEFLDEAATIAANKANPSLAPKLKAKVIYNYDAVNEDELTIRVNDVICDVDNTRTDGWWVGKLGKRGLFPKDYVQLEGTDSQSDVTKLPPAVPAKNAATAVPVDYGVGAIVNLTNFVGSFFTKKGIADPVVAPPELRTKLEQEHTSLATVLEDEKKKLKALDQMRVTYTAQLKKVEKEFDDTSKRIADLSTKKRTVEGKLEAILEDEYYGAEVNLEKALTNIEAKLEKERKNLKAIDGMKNLYATTDPKQFKKVEKESEDTRKRILELEGKRMRVYDKITNAPDEPVPIANTGAS